MTEATNQGAEQRLERVSSRTGRLAPDLSEALPVLEIDDLPQQGTPVIAFDRVSKVYPAQPNRPALEAVRHSRTSRCRSIPASSSSLSVIPARANRPLCA